MQPQVLRGMIAIMAPKKGPASSGANAPRWGQRIKTPKCTNWFTTPTCSDQGSFVSPGLSGFFSSPRNAFARGVAGLLRLDIDLYTFTTKGPGLCNGFRLSISGMWFFPQRLAAGKLRLSDPIDPGLTDSRSRSQLPKHL